MLRFLSQNLTIARRSIGGTEEGSYLGHLLLMNEAFGLLWGSDFLTVGVAKRSHVKQGRFKYILHRWPWEL